MTRALIVLAAAATLAACSQIPGPTPADAALPSTYPAFEAPSAGLSAAEVDRREFFGDPRLDGLIDQAIANNRDLRAATARIAEAAALRRIARADRFPTVDFRASARTGEGGAGASFGDGGGTGQPGDPQQPGNPAGTGGSGGDQYRIEIAVSAFELDFWGRVRALNAAALAEYLATVEAQRAFRLSLIADVADAYLTERELAERARLAEQTIESRERSLYLARRLYEEGEGSDLEVQEELALLADARGQLADVRNQSAQAANLLQLLVGAPPSPDLPPPLALADQAIVETVAAGLPSDLLLNRPDLREAEQGLRAAEANVGAARAALFPTIDLTGGLGYASPELNGLFASETFFWNAAANLLQPLFDAGRRRSQVEAERARLQIALAEYELAIQTAFREVADALAARRFLAEQLTEQQAGYAAQVRRLELADLRFDAGVASSVDVLEARRAIFDAEQALVTTRRAQLANAATLYVALGGGD